MPYNAGWSYTNDCAYLSSAFAIVVDVSFEPVCVIRQYDVNIWCIPRITLTTRKRAKQQADCPYTDRCADSAEYFSKCARIGAPPCADSIVFFARIACKFLLRANFPAIAVRKIIVNKFANVADSTR